MTPTSCGVGVLELKAKEPMGTGQINMGSPPGAAMAGL